MAWPIHFSSWTWRSSTPDFGKPHGLKIAKHDEHVTQLQVNLPYLCISIMAPQQWALSLLGFAYLIHLSGKTDKIGYESDNRLV